MLHFKNNSRAGASFRTGHIGELLGKMDFISQLTAETRADSKEDKNRIRKIANSLRYEIRSNKASWGDNSNLETALKDVLHVLDLLGNSGKVTLTDLEVGYAYMGLVQAMFFIRKGISSHERAACPDALAFFTEERQHVENALAMEKQTLAELAYDRVANENAMEETAFRIQLLEQHVHILESMALGVQHMMEEGQDCVEDCDGAAAMEGKEEELPEKMFLAVLDQPLSVPLPLPVEQLPAVTGRLQIPDLSDFPDLLPQSIPQEADGMEGRDATETRQEDTGGGMEEKKFPDVPQAQERGQTRQEEKQFLQKKKTGIFPWRKKKGEAGATGQSVPEAGRLAQSPDIQTVHLQEGSVRDILYAPGRCIFMEKTGMFCYGLSDHVDGACYRNTDRSVCILDIDQDVYDLLTVRFDITLFGILSPEKLAASRKIMQWVYEHNLGNGGGLPLNQYMGYQSYYGKCVSDLLQHLEAEKRKRMRADLMAGEAADLAVLYGRVQDADRQFVKNTYREQILSQETGQLEEVLHDLTRTDVTEHALKERIQGLVRALTDQTGDRMEEPLQAAGGGYGVDSPYPGADIRDKNIPMPDGQFFQEIRNMRMLLKKEDVNGDMEIKAASSGHMSYLVKQFYIMLSYSKELGMEYEGQQIWLYRYDSEKRKAVPAMTMFEKHIRHLDEGQTGNIVRYMEAKYGYLLEQYAGMDE